MTQAGSRRRPLRLAIVGWGAIAGRVAGLLQERNDNITVVGIATRNTLQQGSGLPEGARWLSAPDDLRDLAPDLVVEAAGRAAVEPWGLASLRCAPGFVVSSTSAFSDDTVLQRLVDEAERCGSQILIPSGALAGLDALTAASRLPLECVTHRIIKRPRAWERHTCRRPRRSGYADLRACLLLRFGAGGGEPVSCQCQCCRDLGAGRHRI
jgi:aspartate dehydrogenase